MTSNYSATIIKKNKEIDNLEYKIAKALELSDAVTSHQNELHNRILDINSTDDQNQINNTNLEERIMNSFCSIDAMLNKCVKSNEDEQ